MGPEDTTSGWEALGRWIGMTAAGWLLGFVLVIVLATAWSATGGTAQFMVGVGMGAGVGFLQARVLGSRVDRPRRWLWASVLGMGLPFLLWDVGAGLGLNDLFSMPACALVGSLLVGVLQGRLLRPRFTRAPWWIPACVVGWGLPVGITLLGDSGPPPNPWPVLAAIVFGGVMLGAVSGAALEWIARSPRRSERQGEAA